MDPSFEFTFSYWIFAWFLVFYAGYTKYNPKSWLVLAFLNNLYVFIFNHKLRSNRKVFALFILVDIVIKVIPLWLLRNTAFKYDDFIIGWMLFFVFLTWMFVRLGSYEAIIRYFSENDEKAAQGKVSTPFLNLLQKAGML